MFPRSPTFSPDSVCMSETLGGSCGSCQKLQRGGTIDGSIKIIVVWASTFPSPVSAAGFPALAGCQLGLSDGTRIVAPAVNTIVCSGVRPELVLAVLGAFLRGEVVYLGAITSTIDRNTHTTRQSSFLKSRRKY